MWSKQGVAAAIATWIGVSLVYLALWPVLGSLDGLFDVLRFIGSDGGRLKLAGLVVMVLSVIRAVLITPLAEELLFRGAVYGWVRRWLPGWATIAATALVFAAIKGFLVLMPYVLIFGVIPGWLRERTDSPAAGAVTHLLNNTMLVVATAVLTG